MFFVCETLYLEHISAKTKLERFNKIYLIRKLVKYKRDNNQLKILTWIKDEMLEGLILKLYDVKKL